MITVGSIVKHKKRGTSYIIVGDATAADNFKDGQEAYRFYVGSNVVVASRPSEDVPYGNVSVQVSLTETVDRYTQMWIYRSLHDAYAYARPKTEFTRDRFIQVDTFWGKMIESLTRWKESLTRSLWKTQNKEFK